jgi:hypothetical protein
MTLAGQGSFFDIFGSRQLTMAGMGVVRPQPVSHRVARSYTGVTDGESGAVFFQQTYNMWLR